ncbi:type II toxin-antitoxin system RelE/ParE family toxin [Granulicella sp. dw_53]|uniref:type II toxin-antitoxin system RelE/ParE family toxin n=1 Tax=Granulicella sp. dw_53 TaxID=2719792 RepID=UPI001BD41C13
MHEIRHYVTASGVDIFDQWQSLLRDNRARAAVDRRVARIELGNFGDHKFCREGVWELRIDFGPGYRVYYAKSGDRIILLLCGGDKSKQSADIDLACKYWADWKGRANER